MRRTLNGVIAAAAVIVVAAVPATASAAPGAAAVADRGAARVSGWAEFALPFGEDDDVRSFAFDARSVPYSRPIPIEGGEKGSPTDAVGTVRVAHWVAEMDVTVRFEATVDCMITSPGHATLTAIVTRADEYAKRFRGKRVGFSVQDSSRGPDRVSFSWDASLDQNEAGEWGEARIGTCLAPAAFATVTRGNYTVRHAELTAPPADR